MQKSKVCYARVSSEHQRGQQIRTQLEAQRVCFPFWNEYTLTSKKWWLPKNNACVASDMKPDMARCSRLRHLYQWWQNWKTCRRLTCNRHSVCVCGDIIDYVLLQIAEKKRYHLRRKKWGNFQKEKYNASSFSYSGGANKTQKMNRNSTMDVQQYLIVVKKGVNRKKRIWRHYVSMP